MYDMVTDMEDQYELKDPKLLTADPDYPTLGPIPICAYLQKHYTVLLKRKIWAAKSLVRPEASHTPAVNDGGIVPNVSPAATGTVDINIPPPPPDLSEN